MARWAKLQSPASIEDGHSVDDHPPHNLSDVLSTRVAQEGDRAGAVMVWRSANVARGLVPGPERVARVEAKLAEPSARVVVVRGGDELVGMALAKPFRRDRPASLS